MAQGVVYTGDTLEKEGGRSIPHDEEERIVKQVEKHADFFVLLCLQDHKLVNTNQYLIACSIVSAARTMVGLWPQWSLELEQLTGLQHSHFCNIEKRLLAKYDQSSAADKAKRLAETVKRIKPADIEGPSEECSAKASLLPQDDPVAALAQLKRKEQEARHHAELNGSAILLSNMNAGGPSRPPAQQPAKVSVPSHEPQAARPGPPEGGARVTQPSPAAGQ